MQTNTVPFGALHEKAQGLIHAAEAYWQEYQETLSPAAVVWLKADDGSLVLFTRGEYSDRLMAQVDYINASEPPLEHLFASE